MVHTAFELAAEPGSSGGKPTGARLELAVRPRVLLVEDDADIREATGEVLESMGYRVVSATNGAEALAVLEEIRPAIILLDLMMPVMDGSQVLAEVRRTQHQPPPVIVLTATRESERPAGLRDSPVVGVLPKPYSASDLVTLMRAAALGP